MKKCLALTMLLMSAGCATVEVPRQRDASGDICHWGKAKFDLCQYATRDEKVEALLGQMTLDEKIGQMTQSIWHNGVSPRVIRKKKIGSIIQTDGPVPGDGAMDWINTFDEFQQQAMKTRLGIPLLIGVDAVHGQNTFDGAVIFPHNIGMAATGNMELIEQAARITAEEMAGTGFNWTFSPCIALPQHEHWGRVYEAFSEDLDLTVSAAIASVQGLQGPDLAARNTVAATAKHYIGDGATAGGIEGGDAIITDGLLRDYHLPPYAAAVQQDVAAVMVGFNSVNGTKMHHHTELVTGVLKGELGFRGVVVTDWNGGLRFGPAHLVINAGIDIAMQPGNHVEFMKDLKRSVLNGTVPISRIDDAVRRILQLKFRLGLFADPFGKREFAAGIGSAEHRAVARQAVRESLVLLKSENDVLPLKPSDRIAVIGEHGNNSGLQSGGWTIHWQGQTESYKGATTIFEAVKAAGSHVEYAEKGCYAGMEADIAVVVVGEYPYAEMKGDSNQLWLSDAHRKLISGCKALGKNVVVILISGRALAVQAELQISDAFIAAWLPGSEGGGVADFLFGTDGFKPRGRTPFSWPVDAADLPLAPDADNALFKLGYGLQDY